MTIDTLQVSETAAREVLADGDSSATALMVLALLAFPDLLVRPDPVESIEIWMAVEERFGIQISEICENRVNALWLMLSGDGFYEDPEIFTAVCCSLFDGDIGDPLEDVTSDLGIEEILWALYEASLWTDDPPELSERVKAVIRRCRETDALEIDESELIVARATALRGDLAKLGVDENDLDNFLLNHATMGQSAQQTDEAPAIAGFREPG